MSGPVRAAIPAIFHNPAFWRGASAARTELLRRRFAEIDELRYHAAIKRYETIEAALAAGTPLERIPDFADWLGPALPAALRRLAA